MAAFKYDPWSAHARGLQEFQNKSAKSCPTFVWGGKTYYISPNTITQSDPLSIGGLTQYFKLRFRCLTSELYTPTMNTPELLRQNMLNTELTYLGGAYKIQDIQMAPNGYVVSFDCNAVNEGV